MSQLAGSDIGAVEQGDEDTGVIVMRDPQYAINDVLIALIAEIRRLRWLCLRDYKMP